MRLVAESAGGDGAVQGVKGMFGLRQAGRQMHKAFVGSLKAGRADRALHSIAAQHCTATVEVASAPACAVTVPVSSTL